MESKLLKKRDPLKEDLGRQLAMLPDVALLTRLQVAGKYATTAKILLKVWENLNGKQISDMRFWIIKALIVSQPGDCPWPSIKISA